MHLTEEPSKFRKETSLSFETAQTRKDSKDFAEVNISSQLFIGEQIPTLLPCKHWLENCDPKHRYGTYLRPYYDYWCSLNEGSDITFAKNRCKDFFQWLDHGGGKYFDLPKAQSAKNIPSSDKGKKKEMETNDCQSRIVYSEVLNFENEYSTTDSSEFHDCSHRLWYSTSSSSSSSLLSYFESNHVRPRNCVSRKKLDESIIKYCTSNEKLFFQIELDRQENKMRWKNRPGKPFIDTFNGHRWIFVIDEYLNMFVNQKRKASFHHSSFVSGNPVRAAGRIDISNGQVKKIAPNSGHYLTSMLDLTRALFEVFGTCTLPLSCFREDSV